MTARVRVAVVGTGFGARTVAPAFAAVDACEVVDVVSPRDPSAVAAAIARADIDLVSVHSPPFLHAEHVRRALDAGHAVLCDKPFTRSAEESAMLASDAATAQPEGVHLLNFEFRFHPVRAAMRAAIAEATVGEVERLSWTHVSSGSRIPLRPYGWLFSRDLGGGWIGAWASHAIDTIRWCIGEIDGVEWSQPCTDVAERPDRDGVPRACDAEDGLVAGLRLSGGARAVLDSTFAASVNLTPRIAVLGERGALEAVGERRLDHVAAGGARTTLVDGAPSGHLAPMARAAAAVIAAVREGAPDPALATFADGVACDRVLDRLRSLPVATAVGDR